MTRTKRSDLRENLINFAADVGVYFFSVVGVMISKYLPQFRTEGWVEVGPMEWSTVVMSCIIAFMISFGMDFNTDRDGARLRWKRRAAFALTNGAMWYTIIGG